MSEYNYNYGGGPSPGPGPGSPGPRPPKKDTDWGGVSWAISVALIFLWFPLGLFLTFAHSAGHDILGNFLRGLFGGRRQSGQSRPGAGAGYSAPKKTRTAKSGAQAKPKVERARRQTSQTEEPAGRFGGVRRPDVGATAKTVFGWILVALGFMATVGAVSVGDGIWFVLSMASVALGGGALILSAIQSRRKAAKFHRCFTVSGDKGVVDMKKLAKTLGVDLAEADKLFTEMVDRGYYGEKAYIDHERCLLVIDVEQMRDVYRREDEQKAAQAAREPDADQSKMNEYERYVEQIRQADVDIDDEVMSEKIRRMQTITAAIFKEVEDHPEKRSQIDRFMNYYLPTTLKLLDSYARIEDRGVTGENTAKAKADIERIADTLVAGYETQLDKLYRAEAMDIAGDVSVIENMLKRDGLSGESDFGQTAGGH